jgi:hypothetical protein
MKNVCLSILFLLISFSAGFGQHVIGIPKDKVVDFVNSEMKGFNLDNSSKNESYNYFKFVNSAGTKTLIVFFSEENVSVRTRMVCDFSEFDFVVEELNGKYKKITDTSWEYKVDDDYFIVNLEEKEWYFVVTTKKK